MGLFSFLWSIGTYAGNALEGINNACGYVVDAYDNVAEKCEDGYHDMKRKVIRSGSLECIGVRHVRRQSGSIREKQNEEYRKYLHEKYGRKDRHLK